MDKLGQEMARSGLKLNWFGPRMSHSKIYIGRISPFLHQNHASGIFWGPPWNPKGVGLMSTPSDSLHREYEIQKKKSCTSNGHRLGKRFVLALSGTVSFALRFH